MSISRDEVLHVAKLARLELDENELHTFHVELNSLLAQFDLLSHADLMGFEKAGHVISLTNVMDYDVQESSLPHTQALKGAYRTHAGLFIVPKVIED